MIHLVSRINTSLRVRLLFWVWLISSAATFVITSLQLVADYSAEEGRAFDQIEVIRKNYLPSIAKSAWDYDEKYLELLVGGMRNLPYVSHIAIISEGRKLYGEEIHVKENAARTSELPLEYEGRSIGALRVGLDIEGLRQSYIWKALKIFAVQGVKTLVVCFLLLRVFDNVIMRHLFQISNYLRTFRLDRGENLELARDRKIDDELTMLETSLNDLRNELSTANDRLLTFNRELEQKVEERTKLLDEERVKSMHSSKLAALGEMAGGIAHEINNPLAIMVLTSTNLQRLSKKGELPPEKLQLSLEQMDSTLVRITRIVNGLRNVSRGSDQVKLEKIRLSEIIQDVFGLCSEKFRNHGITIIGDQDLGRFEHVINCDRVQLSQVLLNLMSNAFDAIEEHDEKWVAIDYGRADGFDVITVSDSGPGVAPEVAEKMFQPFFTTKDVGKGTGLGLSIADRILKKLGGSIEYVRSERTSFVLKIPVA